MYYVLLASSGKKDNRTASASIAVSAKCFLRERKKEKCHLSDLPFFKKEKPSVQCNRKINKIVFEIAEKDFFYMINRSKMINNQESNSWYWNYRKLLSLGSGFISTVECLKKVKTFSV